VIFGGFGSAEGRQSALPILVSARLRSVLFQNYYGTMSEDRHQCLRKNGRYLKSVPISMFDVYEASTDDLTRFGDFQHYRLLDFALSDRRSRMRSYAGSTLSTLMRLLTGSVRSLSGA
jgi:hypothetical protein